MGCAVILSILPSPRLESWYTTAGHSLSIVVRVFFAEILHISVITLALLFF